MDSDTDPLGEFSFYLLNSIFRTFSIEAIIGFIVLLILLFLSAMISGSEVAYFSLNPGQLKDIQNRNKKNDRLIISLLDKPNLLLATILIANNFANVAIVILSTYITAEVFNLSDYPVLAFVIQVVVITALILFVGEILPKVYSTQRPVSFAGMMSVPLRFLIRFFYPISTLLVKSTNLIDKRITNRGLNISRSDLSEAIEITSDKDTHEEERKILQGIVKFGDIDVKEIMKARTNVTAIDIEIDYSELLNIILESGYSRIPVFKGTFDSIEGILYIKDLLSYLDEKKKFNWQKLIRPAFFVPENKKINDLLKEFQSKKIHLAIVVDEYGGTSGIVTLEDVLEEIVGEISDEFDNQEDEMNYKKIDENNYIFEGKTTIIDFCKIINIDDEIFDKIKGEADSLAGLILELEGKIPEKSDSIIYKNFTFKIEAVDNRRIKEIKVTINPKTR